MIKLKLLIGLWIANLTRRLKNNFYLYLALLFSIVILLDAGVFHMGLNMRDKAFDFMVKNRIYKTKADQDIVIVDINEASLASMSKEYGRWPWPRQVLGEFLENIQVQQPKAVVFDILFSDADIYNPDSDAYFDEVIAAGDNVFFPILRLDPSQDALSQLRYAQIPGLVKQADADQEATIAAILPFLSGAHKTNRLGTHNVYPHNDGIVREYRLYHDDAGWILPSLPLLVGNDQSADTTPLPKNMLINWRGKPFSYQYVSFSDVFTDLTSQHKQRPANEFTNKIVIVGSTAAGLFDIKPTAMDKQFPGVEVLATAIDNVKHRDYLKVWRGKLPYVVLSLLFIWVTTLAFYFKVDRDKFNTIFTGSQIGLLVLSYLAINFTNSYLDLTAPLLWAVAFFGIAKIYALATDRALQRWLAFGIRSEKEDATVLLMAILIEKPDGMGEAMNKNIKRQIELNSKTPNTIEILHGVQTGIWGLFDDIFIVSWVFSSQDEAYGHSARQDAQLIMAQLPVMINEVGLPASTLMRYATHEGTLIQAGQTNTQSIIASQWRTLFAQAIIKLEHIDAHTNEEHV